MDENESKLRILDTAARLFGERGKSAVSTTEIAREAGINKAMIFYYFGSKDELYQAAFRKWFGDLFTHIREKIEGIEPGLPLIEAFVRAHTGYLLERPGLVKLIIRELLATDAGPPPAIAEVMASFQHFERTMIQSIEIAKERGEIRNVDPLQTAVNIISMDVFIYLGKPIVSIMAPDIDIRAFIEDRVNHILDLLMNGLRTKTE
jgi:AcrR family transcriptional regulator